MIPDEIFNLPDNPCNEHKITKVCPDCNDKGFIAEMSDCCGSARNPDTCICYECLNHSDPMRCKTCDGAGDVELTDEEIQDLKEIAAENLYEANKSER
jgi:RecJ-like exonuclease